MVGDRWTLLIVRELLIQGPSRFGEVQRGLPGIATNLLTVRLRDLEANGLVTREPSPSAPGVPMYRLTDRGMALDGVLRELLKWGAPTVPDAPRDAIFQMHWLSQPARFLLQDRRPTEPAVLIRFGTLDDGFDLTAAEGSVAVQPCKRDVSPLATVTGPGPVLVALLQGALPLAVALANGVRVDGDTSTLDRVLPPAHSSINVPGQYS
ncbi:winged helix-turn-helix transcriptional regulator [Quadrisphaera granulorum]|uniref:winged helix-turn-helix transcriptional regulator n=1 Tax=Quadrisphaera granulorum TaxID=317664 RepID=UPI001B85CCCD|nr:helix-turn-helix domain-containing protein [Quadrisphaera granulorum]